MSIETSLDLAIDLFKQTKYKEALEQYNSIVKKIQKYTPDELSKIRLQYGLTLKPVFGPVVHPKVGSVLDQRAATYEKLNNIPKALRDAENLIRLEPLSCKGYLRVAKLKLLLEQEIECYKVLQRGVYTIESAVKKYNVEVPKVLFDKLKGKYRDLNQKLKQQKKASSQPVAPSDSSKSGAAKRQASLDDALFLHKRSKSSLVEPRRKNASASPSVSLSQSSVLATAPSSSDPFDYFPLELISEIFSRLPLRAILRCHLVSSQWYNTLTCIPYLYQTLPFKNRIDKAEFLNGLKLIKKVYQNSSSSTVKALKLSKSLKDEQFLDLLKILAFQSFSANSNLNFEKFEIINPNFNIGEILLSFIYPKVNSTTTDLSGLRPFQNTLKSLKLGVSSEMKNFPYLLGVSDCLKELEIIQLKSESDSKKVRYNPLQYPTIKEVYRERINCSHLETFTIIGHPDDLQNASLTASSSTLYSFLKMATSLKLSTSSLTFPLRSLTIVSQDLSQFQSIRFESFPQLEEVYFENNTGYSLSDFILGFTPSSIEVKTQKLAKLVFRERDLSTEFDVTTLRNLEFPRLSSIKLLDLYSCNLTKAGLFKLLEVVNKDGSQLTSLNIGNSRKLGFQVDTLHRHRGTLPSATSSISIADILKRAPNLTHLYLNEIEFDNFSAKMFYKDLKDKYDSTFTTIKLKYLDLSFVRLDGIGLMDLFCVSSRVPVTFQLDDLVLNGIDVNQQTIQLLMDKGYVGKVHNDFHKARWREFGVNSLIQ